MLDISFIRANLEICKKAAIDKNREVDWNTLLTLDERRRELIGKIENLRAERNKWSDLHSPNLPTNLKRGGETLREEGKKLKSQIKDLEKELRNVENSFNLIMLTIPNVPDKSVPVGKDASGNVKVHSWGKIPTFIFPPKDHIDLAKSLDLIDFERGAKVGGFRTYFLKNEAAQLELAILFYTFQKLASKGYTPLIAPSLVREFTLFGNGQFPWGAEEVYRIEKDNLYLAGTAEVPVTAYYSGEILEEKDLPKKFVAFSACFRREAGSYGKDTKGAYRLHQFNKVEQLIVSTNDMSKSFTLLEELRENAEGLLQDLELPYRVMLMCTGEMGEPQIKKYDVETWMPGRPSTGSGPHGGYGETMSDSFMGDFQARRLKIRYRTKDGKIEYCHTLNNTAIASPRIIIAILENYQQKDGSVRVPKVLIPYLGKDVIRR